MAVACGGFGLSVAEESRHHGHEKGARMQRWIKGDPPVELILRRTSQARRFSLRVSRLDGRVTLSMPERARESDALAFAEAQADWIRRAQARTTPLAPVGFGSVLPIEGRAVTLTPGPVKAPMLAEQSLILPPDPTRAAVRAEAYLKLHARARLQAASDHYAARAGCAHGGVSLRDTRSRWGSCSAEGRLMYSWRLIMAPPEVLDYVAAHEVAHLLEMNHSPAFWAVVRGLMPDYQTHRRWLKSSGNDLHRHLFRPPS